jgi:hypothetical protein
MVEATRFQRTSRRHHHSLAHHFQRRLGEDVLRAQGAEQLGGPQGFQLLLQVIKETLRVLWRVQSTNHNIPV